MSVYFIQVGEDGPVKIGRSYDVQQRLAGLQVSHHLKLHLRCEVSRDPGDLSDEQTEALFHRKFEQYRLRGEWFSFEGTLKVFLGNPAPYDGKAALEAEAARLAVAAREAKLRTERAEIQRLKAREAAEQAAVEADERRRAREVEEKNARELQWLEAHPPPPLPEEPTPLEPLPLPPPSHDELYRAVKSGLSLASFVVDALDDWTSPETTSLRWRAGLRSRLADFETAAARARALCDTYADEPVVARASPPTAPWIAVSTKLPEIEEDVLVCLAGTDMKAIAVLYADGAWSVDERVTYWMPLPKGPA